MKAVVLQRYGSPDHFKVIELEKPVPKDREVLVKVHAVSLNSWDWDILNGVPFANRVDFGFRKPKKNLILGADISGRVEQVGRKVNQFKPGDKVLGDLSKCGWGGLAEYVCASEDALAIKPSEMEFVEAAAIPQAAMLAFQGLRHKKQLEHGQKVLINGAGGGSGTFAVKLAKSSGAIVTAVDKGSKLEMLRSIGADHVIDYQVENFIADGQKYDLILDVVTFRSIFEYRRQLHPGGAYIILGGGSWAKVSQGMFLGPLISLAEKVFSGKKAKKMGLMILKSGRKHLESCMEALDKENITPEIDSIFTFDEVPEAFRFFGKGLVQGKLVITVGNG